MDETAGERRRLEDLYSRMTQEELQLIASDPDSLTEIARLAVRSELQRRGITTAAEAPSSTPSVGETEIDSRLFIICRFRDVHEALLAQVTLESAGIESFLADENTVRMDWMWSNAIGGVKLMVRDEDAAEAADLLEQPIPERLDVPGVGEYEQPKCPQCGSLEVIFEEMNDRIAYGSVFVGVPLPLHRQGWKCRSCDYTWSDSEIEP